MASIQVDDEQVEEVTKPTTGKPELNSPAIDEEAPAKTTETSPYFDEDEQEDEVKEDKPEDKDDEEDEVQEKLAAPQIIDEDDEDGVEPAFSIGGASKGNEFSEEEDDAHDADD